MPAARPTAEPLLAVENLCVEFPTRHGTLRAVHDISFAIGPGEVLGVVGESGAGKSLTGAAVIGLIDPPSGCAFHPRCPHANGRCRTERPVLQPAAGGAEVACHAVEEKRIEPADVRACRPQPACGLPR